MCSILSAKLYPHHINGVTAVAKNKLFYNCGSVKFDENIPSAIKTLFLINGSGHNLANYKTSLSIDQNILSFKFEEIPGLFRRITNKLFRSVPNIYEKTFNINNSTYIKQLKKFITTNAMNEHIQKAKGDGLIIRTINRFFV